MTGNAQAIPATWVFTTGAHWNAPAADYGDWLTPDQKARVERIRQARLLFDGKHRQYYLDEGRTQFQFPHVRVGTQTRQMYLTYNVLGLISLKTADLLFGQEPLLRVDVPAQQDALTDLGERCSLHTLLYGCAVDASYEAECFVEAVVKNGEVYLRQVPADEIFPAGELGPDLQYDAYDRVSLQNVGTDQFPVWLVLKVTYAAGAIERHCYQLGDDKRDLREVALAEWPLPAGQPPLAPLTRTGIDSPTIVWVPNLLVRGRAVSDYDGAIDLQDVLNAKTTQVARVLLKHSDPKMVFPEESFDENGNIRSDAEAFPFNEPEKIPKYITWDAQLTAALEDRKFALNQLLVRTETSPVLLGLKEGAAPDAYKKVRLEAFNSITKAARKAAIWKQGIRRMVDVAQDLENTLQGVRYDRTDQPIGVELRDGIPVDDLDQAQTIATLRTAGVMSVRRALELQLGDPAAVEKELAELEEERAQMTPTVFGGDPQAGGEREAGEGQMGGGGGPGAGEPDPNAGNPDAVAGATNSFTDSGVPGGQAAEGRAA